MTKLSEFIEPFAEAIGMPVKSVNVLAMHLRKAGLITTGGRGRGGAEIGASDATNLLLAAMSGCQSKDAPEVVLQLRSSGISKVYDGHDESELYALPFSIVGSANNLGGALDSIFSEIISRGMPVNSRTNQPLLHLGLRLREPSRLGTSATIWLNDGREDWTLIYEREGEELRGKSKTQRARLAEAIRRSTGILRQSQIAVETFKEIGNAFYPGLPEAHQ